MKHIKIYEQFDEWDPFGEELQTSKMNKIEKILVEIFGKYYKIENYLNDADLKRIMESYIMVENNYRVLYFEDWDKHILYFFSEIERKRFYDTLRNRVGLINVRLLRKPYCIFDHVLIVYK